MDNAKLKHHKKRAAQRNRATANRAARGRWKHQPLIRKNIGLAMRGQTDWITIEGDKDWVDPTQPFGQGQSFNLDTDQSARVKRLHAAVMEVWRHELSARKCGSVADRYLRQNKKSDLLMSMLKMAWFLFDQVNADARRRARYKGVRWAKGMPAPVIEDGRVTVHRIARRQNVEAFPQQSIEYLKKHVGLSKGQPRGVGETANSDSVVSGQALNILFQLVQTFAKTHGFQRAEEKLYLKNHWPVTVEDRTVEDTRVSELLRSLDDDLTPMKMAEIASEVELAALEQQFLDVHRSRPSPEQRRKRTDAENQLRGHLEANRTKSAKVRAEGSKKRVLGKPLAAMAPHHQIMILLGHALDERIQPTDWEDADIKSRRTNKPT